ncbi:MAG: hypothetical protein J0H02_17365 [Armatimonadetes bacterium]|nr:hypothetical protein [Armatimonadota bacterium]
MKRPILIVAVILVVLVGIRTIMSLGGPDDKQLVREALKKSIVASKEGRPGGVLDKLSKNLTVDGQSVGSSSQISQFIKSSKPDIEVVNTEPVVIGDEAKITSPVKVKFSLPGGNSIDRTIEDVTLTFAREDSMKWLIFPSKQWRLREVTTSSDITSLVNPW